MAAAVSSKAKAADDVDDAHVDRVCRPTIFAAIAACGVVIGDHGVLVGDDGELHAVPTKVKKAFDDYFGVNSYADPDYFDDVNEYFDDLDDPDPNGFDDHDRA